MKKIFLLGLGLICSLCMIGNVKATQLPTPEYCKWIVEAVYPNNSVASDENEFYVEIGRNNGCSQNENSTNIKNYVERLKIIDQYNDHEYLSAVSPSDSYLFKNNQIANNDCYNTYSMYIEHEKVETNYEIVEPIELRFDEYCTGYVYKSEYDTAAPLSAKQINQQAYTEITTTKEVDGVTYNYYPIYLKKLDVANGTIQVQVFDRSSYAPLSGARFNLLAAEDIYMNSQVVYEEDETVSSGSTDKQGIVKFTSLPLGNYYLEEADAPNGYASYKQLLSASLDNDQDIKQINVYYDKPVSDGKLPQTGSWTNALIGGGSILVLGGLVFVIMYYKKKNEVQS